MPQTWPMSATPGGAAAWLPWQVLQTGAAVSPFSKSALPWTLPAMETDAILGARTKLVRKLCSDHGRIPGS